MSCQFRFVAEAESQAVALRLFTDVDGQEKADVTGPLADLGNEAHCGQIDRCVVNKSAALTAAIRIANANDAEVVVLGDAESWDARWGVLISEGYSHP